MHIGREEQTEARARTHARGHHGKGARSRTYVSDE